MRPDHPIRQIQNEVQLTKLHRLNIDGTKVKPALRTIDRLTNSQNYDQQCSHDDGGVLEESAVAIMLQGKVGTENQDDNPQHNINALLNQVTLGRTPILHLDRRT